MKSLKKIVSDKETIFNQESYISDKLIIMDWVEENFGLDLIDFIIFIFKNQMDKFDYLNRQYIEHQSWNATTFSDVVVSKIYNDYKEKGKIGQENYPLFTCLLRMYIDGNWDYNKINPQIKEIIENYIVKNGVAQTADPYIARWIEKGIKNKEE